MPVLRPVSDTCPSIPISLLLHNVTREIIWQLEAFINLENAKQKKTQMTLRSHVEFQGSEILEKDALWVITMFVIWETVID